MSIKSFFFKNQFKLNIYLKLAPNLKRHFTSDSFKGLDGFSPCSANKFVSFNNNSLYIIVV